MLNDPLFHTKQLVVYPADKQIAIHITAASYGTPLSLNVRPIYLRTLEYPHP
jgi:hypothetical protein